MADTDRRRVEALRAAKLFLEATSAATYCRDALNAGDRTAALTLLGDMRDSLRELELLDAAAPELAELLLREARLSAAIAEKKDWPSGRTIGANVRAEESSESTG